MIVADCPHPTRYAYRSLAAACHAAIRMDRDLGDLRPYRCQCGWWHLPLQETK